MTRIKGSPRMKEVITLAENLGYRVERTRNCHLRFRHPNGAQVFAPTTPSDNRAAKNTLSQLKREHARHTQENP